MYKRMMLILWMGIVGVLAGVTMAVLGSPGPVPALITAISGGWIGVAIAAKLSKGVRDEMVVRVEHISAYYAFNATFYFICVLIGVRTFSNLTLGVGELLFTLPLFMVISYLILKYVLLRRGKTE
jgi:LytS/YehU family sensor histidine kinase